MSHKIGEQRYIVVSLQKLNGKKMPKTMRVHYLFIYSVFMGIVYKLLRNTSCGDLLTKTVLKKEVIVF